MKVSERHPDGCQVCNGILAIVRSRNESEGFGPSFPELREELGLSSLSVVAYHVTALHQKGRLTHRTYNDRYLPRSLAVRIKGAKA